MCGVVCGWELWAWFSSVDNESLPFDLAFLYIVVTIDEQISKYTDGH